MYTTRKLTPSWQDQVNLILIEIFTNKKLHVRKKDSCQYFLVKGPPVPDKQEITKRKPDSEKENLDACEI